MYCASWCEIEHIDNWLLRPDILKGGDAGGFQTVGHIPLVGNRSTADGVQLTMEKYGVELSWINMFFEEKRNKKQFADAIMLTSASIKFNLDYFSCSWIIIKKNVDSIIIIILLVLVL